MASMLNFSGILKGEKKKQVLEYLPRKTKLGSKLARKCGLCRWQETLSTIPTSDVYFDASLKIGASSRCLVVYLKK